VENISRSKNSLAHRIATAFKNFKAFVFQSDIDDRNTVMRLINSTGLSHLLEIKPLDTRYTIYIIYPREKPCRRKCIYDEKLTGIDLNRCIDRCIHDLIEKLAQRLLSES